MVTEKKKKVADVKRLAIPGGGNPVNNRDDLANIVEEPCLAACRHLYDRNIRTFMSNGNVENANGKDSIA